MTKHKIIIEKANEGEYVAYVAGTGINADIERIYEFNALEKAPVRYRVDFEGKTKYSLLPLGEAKAKAKELLKTELKKRHME